VTAITARTPRFSALSLVASLLLVSCFSAPARAGDEPFTSPSNYGVTGLLETPNARVMKENRYRLGATQVHPYRYYFGTVGLFDRVEVNGRFIESLGIPTQTGSSSKDKAFDFKLQILKEQKYLPAFSVVVSDPTGTRIYASQSVVLSKQIFPFDFSFGFGNGRLGKEQLPEQGEGFKIEMFSNPSAWWQDALPFGGIQFAPADWITLMAEYSPTRYERQTRDPAQPKYFQEAVPSKFNAGVRLKPFRWAEIDVSWQRGQEIGVSASVSFDIGRPILPIYDPPYREPEPLRRDPIADRIAAALHATGFSDIGVEGDDFSLRIDAENDRYFFTPSAVDALLDAIAPIVPPGYDYVRVRIKENGIPMAEFLTTTAALEGLREGRIPRNRFFELSAFRTQDIGAPIPRTVNRRWFDWGVGPSFEMFINDPARYVSYRLGVTAYLHAFTWKGGTAVLGVEAYPFSTVTTADAQLSSIPVRSDIALYKEQTVSVGQLFFEQIGKGESQIYGRAAAGLLEIEYAGVDVEVALPLFRGRLIADAGGSLTRKRAPDDPFAFTGSTWYRTALLGARLNIPEADLWFDVKGGRFLAGDYGARFSVSKFIRGVTLSAWYSATDTSIFSDSLNRGYHDKGISVVIPIRLFLGRDSRTAYGISFTPWTRDVAQDIYHHRTLLDFIGRNTEISLDKDTRTLFQ